MTTVTPFLTFSGTCEAAFNFSLSVNTDSVVEVTRIFNALSEGGSIIMPLNETFWGAYFGMFTDKFGIHCMVNCELKEG